MNILTTILGAIFGGSGAGAAVTNVGKSVALVTLAPVLWHWWEGHGSEIAVSLTWGQLGLCAAFAYALVQVAHRTAAPATARYNGLQ